jgi:hypothetical protein
MRGHMHMCRYKCLPPSKSLVSANTSWESQVVLERGSRDVNAQVNVHRKRENTGPVSLLPSLAVYVTAISPSLQERPYASSNT